MRNHYEQDHLHDTSINNQPINQRSTASTSEHEIHSATQTMKFQPQRQNPKIESKSDPSITIRWGGRAVARRQTPATPVDLARSGVDRAGGWASC